MTSPPPIVTPPPADNVGASNIVNAPLTPEMAAERMQQLKDDPAFQERAAKLDPAAFEEHLKL